MTISILEVESDLAINSVGLVVEESGADLTAKSGAFTLSSVVWSLDLDQVFTMTPNVNKQWIQGDLTKQISTGDIVLLVDELIDDGVDSPFEYEGSDYELLHTLFRCEIVANETDYSNSTVQVVHIVALTPPEAI